MAVETKDVIGEEKKSFQEMLPPDGYETDWQKQFKLMDRHRNNRARAEQIAFFGVGFLLAAFVPGLYELKIAAIVLLAVWFAACAAIAVKTHLTARDIDRKLDEEVRVEKEAAKEAAEAAKNAAIAAKLAASESVNTEGTEAKV